MPILPAEKTYRGGFYNNFKINGQDDRVYTAEDVRKPYDVVFSDGILPDADGTAGDCLKVTATGGMGISIATGYAKLGGAWFVNERPYNITLDVGGVATRYDCVIIRNDDNDDVREPLIYIKSLSAVPTIDDLERNSKVYEICVGFVKVDALVSEITSVVDTRIDGQLCNTMSGVGATVVLTLENTYYTKLTDESVIPIGIEQYNNARDNLIVIVEGRTFLNGADYAINGNDSITLTIPLPLAGTKIQFQVVKNVNAKGTETIVQEVVALRHEMNAINNKVANYPFNRTYISTAEPLASDGKDGDIWFIVKE